MDMAPLCTMLNSSFILRAVFYPTNGSWLMSVKLFTWAEKKVTQLAMAIGRMTQSWATTTVSQELSHCDRDVSWEEATALHHRKWGLPSTKSSRRVNFPAFSSNAIRSSMTFILSAYERLAFKGTSVFTLNIFLEFWMQRNRNTITLVYKNSCKMVSEKRRRDAFQCLREESHKKETDELRTHSNSLFYPQLLTPNQK